jgi:hypothetical protein
MRATAVEDVTLTEARAQALAAQHQAGQLETALGRWGHQQRSQHDRYDSALTWDMAFARAVLGRDPQEHDYYLGVLRCCQCGAWVLNA